MCHAISFHTIGLIKPYSGGRSSLIVSSRGCHLLGFQEQPPIQTPQLVIYFQIFALAAVTLIVPYLLYQFKKLRQTVYGACELIFATILGFLSAIRIVNNTQLDEVVAIFSFLSALYVGSRGWQNYYDGKGK